MRLYRLGYRSFNGNFTILVKSESFLREYNLDKISSVASQRHVSK